MESVPRHRLDGNGIYTASAVMMSVAVATARASEVEYAVLLAEEDHERLEGWSDRVELLSTILKQIEAKLALGTSSP
jgi:hypothetical protein